MFDFDFSGFWTFLQNPIVLLSIIAPVLFFFGLILGNIVSQPRKNRVLKVSPESGRGIELKVKSEDATTLYCNAVGKIPPQRFIKRLAAYTIVKKGFMKLQNYALWIGRYGTAYVQHFGKKKVKVSLRDAVYTIFGKKLYDQIPEKQLEQIEKGELGVVIEFPDDPLTPEGLPSISEDDINRDADQQAMKSLWSAYETEKRSSVIQTVAWMGTGIAIGIILSLFFEWGAPTIITGA